MKKFKKFKVVAVAVCGLCFFASCSSDEADGIVNNSGNTDVVQVGYIDANGNITKNGDVKNQVLCFGSEEQYNAFTRKIKSISTDEKKDFFDELGFNNLKKIEEIADCELDSIGENCSCEVDFRNEYKKYVSRYAKALVTNKLDSTDLSLYVPASADEDLYPYIVGVNKMVVVNNQPRIINFFDGMNSLDEKMFATKSDVQEMLVTEKGKRKATYWHGENVNGKNVKATGTNDVKCSKMDCSLKVHFSCDVKRTGDKEGDVLFHFGAQKKMWYGWKRTSREFYFWVEGMCSRPGMNIPINTGKELTLSDDNSYVVQIPRLNLYGLTCTRCRNERRPKYCDIGSETFPVMNIWPERTLDPRVGGMKAYLYTYHLIGKVTIWMMCHGEKFKEDELFAKANEGFFENYPCVVCNIDKNIEWKPYK